MADRVSAFVHPQLHMRLDQCADVVESPAGVSVALPFPARRFGPRLASDIAAWSGRARQTVSVTWDVHARAVRRGLRPLDGIANTIAVASAKGGVGKSTTAANLALALSEEGARCGLLDADIYGPSLPVLMGLRDQQPESADGQHVKPLRAHGVICMSIGFLVDSEQPMVWRGPMVTQALRQLIGNTQWGELDYLVIDLPPGTGDIQLTLAQKVPLTGAVIVTTPQDMALQDARRGVMMFEKVGVPVLGVVENMATHVCAQCGHEDAIFGQGGAEALAARFDVPVLASLPLHRRLREQADGGRPTVASEPDGELASRYLGLACGVGARMAMLTRETRLPYPEIVVED
ncbi:MAG: iron-sulfur cluster carrier protein ApbC [Pseudomonadota bacterium]